MKNLLTFVILPIVIIALAVFVVSGIMEPVNFKNEKERRESQAVERLKDIRTLQVTFKTEFGKFANSFDTLLDFYKNGTIRVIKQIGSADDSVAVAQKRVFRDTIRINVRDTLLRRTGFTIDSLPIVPNTNGAKFDLQARIAKVSGIDVPLFEASVPYDILLQGMDRQLIINLNDQREKQRRYQGLKVGSVDQPNNNAGNWE